MRGFRASKTGTGVTLVEVMVCALVLTFVVLMFAATLPMAAKTSRMNGSYAQAVSLCQHKIDQMRAVGYGRLTYDELRTAGIIDNHPSSLPFEFHEVDQLPTFHPRTRGTIDIQDYSTGIKRATVRLEWFGPGWKQSEGSYTLIALIAQE